MMTKREICERLMKTRGYLAAYEKLLLKDNCPFDADDLGACADALRDLLLDLAAPEEKKKKKTSMEIYRPKPIKVLRDPENKHRWKYECPRCRKFTAEKTKYNTIYCGECGHYASTYGWYEGIGFQEIPTDEKTKWPDEPTYNHAKHMLPLEGVIEEMRKEADK